MEKKVCFAFLFLLILSMSFILAANETIEEKAYTCLENKVADKCSSLSSEEKVFSMLAIGKCKDEILSDSKYMSNTKLTAQAILALSNAHTDTAEAETWLIAQNKTPENMDWLLQIEGLGETKCAISYSGSNYNVTIGTDKKINSNAGNCLTLYTGNYWLKITPSCYNEEFTIKCDNSFSTNLLYKKTTADTIYVSSKTSAASGGGSTAEKVNSFCFTQGASCNYEASLWAALVLEFKGHDISSYLPYIITMMDETDNQKYIPQSFLYTLTADDRYKNEIISKQMPDGYWKISDNQYYDSALALLPFQNEDLAEKTKTKDWLKKIQGTEGCWGSIRDTAFLLYSLWPKTIAGETVDMDDCESSNFFCLSSIACAEAEGNVLTAYSGCFGINVCCDKEKLLDNCVDQGGELCSAEQQCLGGNSVASSDSTSGVCCVGGTCGVQETPACELNNGLCKISCSDSEEVSPYDCTYSDVCCMTKKKGSGLVWIIILLVILIILTALGIIFRKQLREIYLKVKLKIQSKFKKGGTAPATTGTGPRFPPTSSARVFPGMVQRKILPPSQPAAREIKKAVSSTNTPAPKKKGADNDFDDVLKKLKEIGK